MRFLLVGKNGNDNFVRIFVRTQISQVGVAPALWVNKAIEKVLRRIEVQVLGKCKGTTKLKRKRLFSCNAAFPNNRIGLRNKPTDLSVRSRHAESTDSNIDRANIARIRTVRFIRARHHMHGNNRFVALSNAFERKKWDDGRIDVVPSHRNHALFHSIGLINANNLSGIANADVQIPSKRIGKSH